MVKYIELCTNKLTCPSNDFEYRCQGETQVDFRLMLGENPKYFVTRCFYMIVFKLDYHLLTYRNQVAVTRNLLLFYLLKFKYKYAGHFL